MKLVLEQSDIQRDKGLEIAVKGIDGDSSLVPVQVFLEVDEGKLVVHIWDGSQEDPIQSIRIGQVVR